MSCQRSPSKLIPQEAAKCKMCLRPSLFGSLFSVVAVCHGGRLPWWSVSLLRFSWLGYLELCERSAVRLPASQPNARRGKQEVACGQCLHGHGSLSFLAFSFSWDQAQTVARARSQESIRNERSPAQWALHFSCSYSTRDG